jgi:hypothetical protein
LTAHCLNRYLDEVVGIGLVAFDDVFVGDLFRRCERQLCARSGRSINANCAKKR